MRFSYTSPWSSPTIVESWFFLCKKLVKTTTVCDICLFLHKICCKMVQKFCEIWIFYGNCWILVRFLSHSMRYGMYDQYSYQEPRILGNKWMMMVGICKFIRAFTVNLFPWRHVFTWNGSYKMYHIYPKHWNTFSTYHTYPKIWNSSFYYLLIVQNIAVCMAKSLIWVYTVCKNLYVSILRVIMVLAF